MADTIIKETLQKHGCRFKEISRGESSIYEDDATVWFDNPQNSTLTMRLTTFNEENLCRKLKKRTPAEVQASIQVLQMIRAFGDTIRAVGRVPSGELYARVMPSGITIQEYEKVIGILKGCKLIKEVHNELIWIGLPK